MQKVIIDARIARALKLLHSAELAPFVEYLRNSRVEAMEKLAVVTDPVLGARLQGKVQFLSELLENIGNADALVAKTNRQ